MKRIAIIAFHVLVPVLALVGLCLPILALITE